MCVPAPVAVVAVYSVVGWKCVPKEVGNKRRSQIWVAVYSCSVGSVQLLGTVAVLGEHLHSNNSFEG